MCQTQAPEINEAITCGMTVDTAATITTCSQKIFAFDFF